MSIGTCRSDGCDHPRRVRRGTIEPLCEDCYRAACQRVAAQMAAEDDPASGRRRYRRLHLASQATTPAPTTPRSDEQPQPAAAPPPRRPGRPPLISDELLAEAHSRHVDHHQSLRQIARELLEHTAYANARGVELALRRQFKRRGWPTAPADRAA